MPEGRVRTAEGDRVEFRCPKSICEHGRSRARTINVDIAVLERFRARYGFDISGAVQEALYAFAATVGTGRPLGERYTQMPVRLTRTQYYLFKFESLSALSEIVHASLLASEEAERA